MQEQLTATSMEAWLQLSLLQTPAEYTIISCTFYGHLGRGKITSFLWVGITCLYSQRNANQGINQQKDCPQNQKGN